MKYSTDKKEDKAEVHIGCRDEPCKGNGLSKSTLNSDKNKKEGLTAVDIPNVSIGALDLLGSLFK